MTTRIDLARALEGYRFRAADEQMLQAGVERVLRAAGFDVRAEVKLSDASRIDFMVGAVGIEVKPHGSLAALTAQLFRYAEHDAVAELLVLVTSNRLGNLPATILGKPVLAVNLHRGRL